MTTVSSWVGRGQKGYIALLTVLILGAGALAISATLLLTGTDAQRSALVSLQSVQARHLANSCAEEALQLIREDKTYTGSDSLTLGSGTCSFTVASTGTSTRTITAQGTVNNVVKKVIAYATIGSSSISVTSWQEVT